MRIFNQFRFLIANLIMSIAFARMHHAAYDNTLENRWKNFKFNREMRKYERNMRRYNFVMSHPEIFSPEIRAYMVQRRVGFFK